MIDCYNKPGNKNKHPYKTSFQKPSPPSPSKNKNQLFRAQLMCYESPKQEKNQDLNSVGA